MNCKANHLLCLTTKSIVKYIIVLNELFYGMYKCVSNDLEFGLFWDWSKLQVLLWACPG